MTSRPGQLSSRVPSRNVIIGVWFHPTSSPPDGNWISINHREGSVFLVATIADKDPFPLPAPGSLPAASDDGGGELLLKVLVRLFVEEFAHLFQMREKIRIPQHLGRL